MNDPYEISSGEKRPESLARKGSFITGLLWTMVAVLAGTNTILSIAGYQIIASVFGGLAIVVLITLLVRHLKGRRK
ncbi:hypothetical protein FB566_0395 [Stackebrandtia endophytica]|uniref:Uncharacterized protein n=1 Tax=Stackebrandtia endophytica TaxID=1496996 RepID=A0A543AQT9_9ACTN|nr:hypothetical protein [Stackebrandtia endophytica]TQL74905.1 hypothetical protein FB566_0395 [Stackebrandtia endophytica]